MSSRIAWLVDLASPDGVAEGGPGSPLAVLDWVGSADCWSIAGARSLPISRYTRNPKGSLIDPPSSVLASAYSKPAHSPAPSKVRGIVGLKFVHISPQIYLGPALAGDGTISYTNISCRIDLSRSISLRT